MDTVYAALFTAGTLAAIILATLFFFNQQAPKKRITATSKSGSQDSRSAAGSAGDASSSSASPPQNRGDGAAGRSGEPHGDGEEDADGPVSMPVMPASDDDIWKVWFDQPDQNKGMNKNQFEDSMKVLGTFNTMADFWDRFSNLMHEKLPTKSNVRVFQSNVRPLWEDPVNCEGGKWIVVIPKQKSVGVFNEVLAAMVGGKFECEVSGLVLSKKVREDLVSIWTPSGLPVQSLEVLRDNISKLLELHLGLKPEITFMSHDKKNKVSIQGKGEKKSDHKQQQSNSRQGKMTGVKPQRKASPEGSTAKSGQTIPMKPKSPQMAPRVEGDKAPAETSGAKPKTPDTNPLEEGDKQGKKAQAEDADPGWEVVRSNKTRKDKQRDKQRDRFRSL